MKRFWVFGIVVILLCCSHNYTSANNSESSCFCSVYGDTLDDCPCNADTIDDLNDKIHENLIKVLHQDYFRYFQVDFTSPCKWGWDAQCSSPNCHVDTCDLDTLPEHVRNGSTLVKIRNSVSSYLSDASSWLFTTFPYLETVYHDVIKLTNKVTGGEYHCTDPYPEYHDVVQFCKLDPLTNEKCDYVDLVENPEQFTGYSGAAAHQVWRTVYNELCFHPEKDDKTLYLTPETAKEMCVEKRAFYKLVSGLHSSISVHLCSRYLLESGDNPVWGRNLEEFKKRFSPEFTNNEGPERIKNIYFLYLVEMRAVAKIAEVFKSLELDQETKSLLIDVSEKINMFPHHFEETELFKDENLDNKELLEMFKSNFMKISELMDCLGCERCKVWGKLQVTGLGTALKILFNEDHDKLSLTKHEIVALLNSFGRHSTSVTELKYFREADL